MRADCDRRTDAKIRDWFRTLDSDSVPPSDLGKKRKQPADGMSSGWSSPLKRARDGSDLPDPILADADLEKTPRAIRRRTNMDDRFSDTSSLVSSSTKRSTSPTKLLQAQILSESCIRVESIEGAPQAVKVWKTRLSRATNGYAVVSESALDECRNLPPEVAGFDELQDTILAGMASCTDAERAKLGRCPMTSEVTSILAEAEHCEQEGHCEAHWNCAVHYPLMMLALRPLNGIRPVNVTTASISPRDLLREHSLSSRVIDFVFAFDECPEFNRTSSLLYQKGQNQNLNHIEYAALWRKPIACNIETKRTGQDYDKAIQQMSIWSFAHFNRLEQLVQAAWRHNHKSGPIVAQCSDSALGISTRGSSDASLVSIPTLPGIIVQGHDWFFVPSMRDNNGGTFLYKHIPIGTTRNAYGIFKVVAALQIIAEWIHTEYREWLTAHVVIRPQPATFAQVSPPPTNPASSERAAQATSTSPLIIPLPVHPVPGTPILHSPPPSQR